MKHQCWRSAYHMLASAQASVGVRFLNLHHVVLRYRSMPVKHYETQRLGDELSQPEAEDLGFKPKLFTVYRWGSHQLTVIPSCCWNQCGSTEAERESSHRRQFAHSVCTCSFLQVYGCFFPARDCKSVEHLPLQS